MSTIPIPAIQQSSRIKQQRKTHLNKPSQYAISPTICPIIHVELRTWIPIGPRRSLRHRTPDAKSTAHTIGRSLSLRERFQRAEGPPRVSMPILSKDHERARTIPTIPGATEGNKYLHNSFRYAVTSHNASNPTASAAPKLIDLLPQTPMAGSPRGHSHCRICPAPSPINDKPGKRVDGPCMHVFSLDHIARWLEEGMEFMRKCPLCNSVLMLEDDDNDDDGHDVNEDDNEAVEAESADKRKDDVADDDPETESEAAIEDMARWWNADHVNG